MKHGWTTERRKKQSELIQNWKPWQHLERLCRERGLDDFAAREILVEHLGRKVECECQVLFDERELRKEVLRRQFGVDFESGEVGLVDCKRLRIPPEPHKATGKGIREFIRQD